MLSVFETAPSDCTNPSRYFRLLATTGSLGVRPCRKMAVVTTAVTPGPARDANEKGQVVHANERSPTLLVATPPARKGEPRFECTFTLDTERNLCLSARDLVTGALVKLNAPVHRLE